MTDTISKITHGLSWGAVVLAVIATAFWFKIVIGKDAWGALGFIFTVAPIVGGGSLLLGVLPAGILYFQERQRRDLLSLWMASCSCFAIAGETAIFFIL